jgi:hypothetical protein
MRIAHSLLLAPLLLLAPAPLASAAPRSTAATETAVLERALATVSEETIASDVYFLADDELGGRDTPSPGLRIAARYLRARLQSLGFQPGGADGSFFAPYELEIPKLDVERSSATLTAGDETLELAFGKDYYFYVNGVGTVEVNARVVFCGDKVAEDLPEGALQGAWALFHSGKASWRKRQKAVKDAGGLGVIVVPGPGYEGKPFSERYSRVVDFVTRGRVRWPSTPFPFIYVGGPAAERLEAAVATDPTVGRDIGVTFHERRVQLEGAGRIQLENVAGFWPGSDPVLKNEVICLSAHYDHVGQQGDRIYNGADDNGSGSAGLLAVAEALKAYGPMKRSVMILWVSGEEKGLLGSKAWTMNPTLPEGTRAVAAINIDMIGRNAPDYLLITPTREHDAYNGLTKMAEAVGPLEGFPTLGNADEYWHRSDHMNFERNLNIPVAFLFSDVHEDYHKHTDTAEKVDFDKIRRVSRMVVRMLDGLQEPELQL